MKDNNDRPILCNLMAAPVEHVRIMISSRNLDSVKSARKKAATLSDVRRKVAKSLVDTKLFDHTFIEVWINEDSTNSADKTALEKCLEEAAKCDIFIALYNGKAGWSLDPGGIGICHAEFERAVTTMPEKVFLIKMPRPDATIEGDADRKFREYIESLQIWRREAKDATELATRIREAAYAAILQLIHRGARPGAQSDYARGVALDWSRAPMQVRANRMVDVAKTAIADCRWPATIAGAEAALHLNGCDVWCVIRAIPDALSVPQAREYFGQLFRLDHQTTVSSAGPLHIVLCNRGVTETQARNLFGIADATYVATRFGVYAADEVYFAQAIFLKNCRDESSIQARITDALDWIQATGEARLIAVRAENRKRVLKALRAAVTP